MINRAALILKYREPAVRWVNEADPYKDDPGIRLVDVNTERTVYLIDDNTASNPESVERWLRDNYRMLFESELESWYTDPDLWPRDLSFTLFGQWFEIECHSVLKDTVGGEIYDDEA